jgi:hypothetical protein
VTLPVEASTSILVALSRFVVTEILIVVGGDVDASLQLRGCRGQHGAGHGACTPSMAPDLTPDKRSVHGDARSTRACSLRPLPFAAIFASEN